MQYPQSDLRPHVVYLLAHIFLLFSASLGSQNSQFARKNPSKSMTGQYYYVRNEIRSSLAFHFSQGPCTPSVHVKIAGFYGCSPP